MSCRICEADKETRNINLYAFGSEGVDACRDCEMLIVYYIRTLSLVAGRARLMEIKKLAGEPR